MDIPHNDNRDLSTQYFSFGDILALGLMISAGLYFIVTSGLKIAEQLFGRMNELDFFISIITAALGAGFLFAAYRFIRRAAFLKAIADSIFVETLYDRLEPLLADIADTKAGYDVLNERIDYLNYNVNDIRKSIELGKTNPSGELVPVQFAIKNISNQIQFAVLTTITLAMYMFVFYNPGAITPYLSPLSYVLWWLLITSQHDLWDETKAWYWLAIPLLVLPMYTVIFLVLYTANDMLFIMYMGLGAYIILYYFWSERKVRGIMPFEIGEKIRRIRTMLKEREVREVKPHAEGHLRPSHIGVILMVLSIVVFAIALSGYMIENGIAGISWETIGLDIKWEPVYSYAAIGLGMILLVTGFIYVIKLRRQE